MRKLFLFTLLFLISLSGCISDNEVEDIITVTDNDDKVIDTEVVEDDQEKMGITEDEAVIEDEIYVDKLTDETSKEFLILPSGEDFYFESITAGDFLVTFDSLYVYNGNFAYGIDADDDYFNGLTYNYINRVDLIDVLSGTVSGDGLVVLDELVEGNRFTYAPYLGLQLPEGVYVVHFNNNVITYVLGYTIEEAIKNEANSYYKLIYTIKNENLNELSNETKTMSTDDFRSMVYDYFTYDKFYTVGTKEPAEYLSTYVSYYSGYSVSSWVQNTDDYKETNAVLIDDQTEAFAINNAYLKRFVDEFIPEVYEINENGIYVIYNGDVKVIYLKTNSYDYKDYIDFMYGVGDNKFPITTFETGRDIEVEETVKAPIIEPAYEIYPVTEFYKDNTNGDIFQGYFYNTVYSEPNVFLTNGSQTDITNLNINDEIKSKDKSIQTLMEIYEYTTSNLIYGNGEKFGRTSNEIFTSKIATGCTDYGLAFASIAREMGIPTVFVQTARVDWIYDRVRNQNNGITGHILVEVYIDDEWYLVDSTAGKLFLDYDKNNFSLNDGYYVFAKSIEVWDSGVNNESENSTMMMDLFKNFNLDAYQDPVYRYIDLRSGEERNGIPFRWSSDVDISQPPKEFVINDYANTTGELIETAEQTVFYFEADPEKGYNYPYVIILPSETNKLDNQSHKRYLVVEPNNFGKSSNDLSVHIEDVLTRYNQAFPGSNLAEELWSPRLMPIFPRPCLSNSTTGIYTHSLDSTTMFIEDTYSTLNNCGDGSWSTEDTKNLFNLELQMYNMIEDALDRLNEYGHNLESKVFMVGFSASGNFVNRYTTMFPEQLKATYSGGINSNLIIPSDTYNGVELIYPVGTSEHEYLLGKEFNLDDFNSVAKLVYMGLNDTNNTFDYFTPFDQDEKNIFINLFGEEMLPERWNNVQSAFYEVGGEGMFLTNKNAGHGGDISDETFLLEFFKANRDNDEPNYDIETNYDNLIVNKG